MFKKKFLVEFYSLDNPSDIFREEIFSEDIDSVKEEVLSNGYVLAGEPREVPYILSSIEKYFRDNFSTELKYDPMREIIILKALAVSMGKGKKNDHQMFLEAKAEFGRNDKKVRQVLDELVEISKQPDIGHIYDVFSQKPEIFSQDFLALIYETRGKELQLSKIISNYVDEKSDSLEVEGFCQLQEKIFLLKKEIKEQSLKPITYFGALAVVIIGLLSFGVPKFLGVFSKGRDISEDNYYGIGESVIMISGFITKYGLYITIILFLLVVAAITYYTQNESFKRDVQKYILKFPIIGDILTLFYTRKIVSLMAMFHTTQMRETEALRSIIKTINFIPLKEELRYIMEGRQTDNYSSIFASYPEEEKYLTEMFYLQMAKQSSSNSSEIEGLFSEAYASTLKNTDTQWKNSLSRYPKLIGNWIMGIGMGIVVYLLLGVLLIYGLTVVNTANNI